MDAEKIIIGIVIGVVLAVGLIALAKAMFRKKNPDTSVSAELQRDSPEEYRDEPHVFEPVAAEPAISEADLRLRLSGARTVNEFYGIYMDAQSGSALEQEALHGFLAAVREQIAAATSIRECELAIAELEGLTVIGGDAVQREAHEKILSLTSTAESAREFYESYTPGKHDPHFAKRIADRFVEHARAELASANTISACWELRDNVLPEPAIGSSDDVLVETYEKILSLVSTTVEALEFYDDDSVEDDMRPRILVRALELAKTAEDADNVFQQADRDTPLERQAILKVIELTETVEDCETLWQEHGLDHQYGQMAVVRAATIITASGSQTIAVAPT